MRIKALIREYNGGRYGKMGEYIAIVEPQLFKNGKIKKSGFKLIKYIETVKSGYRYGNATHNESIREVLEVLEQ